jgi:SAM-dependent methyltransferase
MSQEDPTQRFSRRVSDYIKHRPNYPDELAEVLRRRVGYHSEMVIADIGSGTGISTRFFLDRGNVVHAVEPNQDMRGAAEEWLGGYTKFHSVAARAEATTLESASIDLVVAAQAFHWFDPERTRAEFKRILRPRGRVALIWNDRDVDRTEFLRDYEQLLFDLSEDYARVAQRWEKTDTVLPSFFDSEHWGSEVLAHQHSVGVEGLIGRAMSSSYVPLPGQPHHEAFMTALTELYRKHAVDGRVTFHYATRLYWGRLS